MKAPSIALEFGAFGGCGFKRQLASGITPGVRKFAVEEESNFDFVANCPKFGIDGLMKFA